MRKKINLQPSAICHLPSSVRQHKAIFLRGRKQTYRGTISTLNVEKCKTYHIWQRQGARTVRKSECGQPHDSLLLKGKKNVLPQTCYKSLKRRRGWTTACPLTDPHFISALQRHFCRWITASFPLFLYNGLSTFLWLYLRFSLQLFQWLLWQLYVISSHTHDLALLCTCLCGKTLLAILLDFLQTF